VTAAPRALALMLAPVVLVLGGLFLTALGLTLLQSLRYLPALGLTRPDLQAYAAILTAPGVLASLGLSLWIALVSTALSAGLALIAALTLRRAFAGRGVVRFLFQLNLTVPHVVGAVGILYLVSQSGALARLAHGGGLIARPAEFPALTHDPWAIGIILLYVWKEVPFLTLILLASLQSIGTDHEATARSLGASRWQAFAHVLLPLILPGLVAGSALVFAFAFGAYEVPLLLGAHAPKALPVLAWQSYTDTDLAARPEAMAMAILIAVVGGAMLALYVRLVRRD
jgi:putative spermidine/putrescine transport system permease protein